MNTMPDQSAGDSEPHAAREGRGARRRAALTLCMAGVALLIAVVVYSSTGSGKSTSPPILTSLGGGFGFGGKPQLIVSFDPATPDAALEKFEQDHAMQCGAKGCIFIPPFGGSAFNYPEHSIALEIESTTSESDARQAAAALRGVKGVIGVQIFDGSGRLIATL